MHRQRDSVDAARRLIVEPVESFLTYDEAALAAVLRLGAGHPYFTQGLCSTIVDAALQESQPTVSLAALQEAVTDLVLVDGGGWGARPR